MRMNAKIAAVAVTGAVFGGMVALSAPSSATVQTTATVVAADPSPTLTRGWCVKSGTGELRNLWLTGANNTCPSPYWGPTKLGEAGPAGPAGPKGDKGDSGSNALHFGHGEFVVKAEGDHGTISISGMPAYSALVKARTLVTTNLAEKPATATITIDPVTPSLGDTTWKFNVVASAFPAALPDFTVTVDVMSAAPAS